MYSGFPTYLTSVLTLDLFICSLFFFVWQILIPFSPPEVPLSEKIGGGGGGGGEEKKKEKKGGRRKKDKKKRGGKEKLCLLSLLGLDTHVQKSSVKLVQNCGRSYSPVILVQYLDQPTTNCNIFFGLVHIFANFMYNSILKI